MMWLLGYNVVSILVVNKSWIHNHLYRWLMLLWHVPPSLLFIMSKDCCGDKSSAWECWLLPYPPPPSWAWYTVLPEWSFISMVSFSFFFFLSYPLFNCRRARGLPNRFHKQHPGINNLGTPNSQKRLPEMLRCQRSCFDRTWGGARVSAPLTERVAVLNMESHESKHSRGWGQIIEQNHHLCVSLVAFKKMPSWTCLTIECWSIYTSETVESLPVHWKTMH